MSEAPANVPALAGAINRLAALVGSLNPNRGSGVDLIDRTDMAFFGCDMWDLANAIHSPYGNELVTVKCRRCEEMIECRRAASPFVSCDKCIEETLYKQKMENYREYWEKTCPANYHADLNACHEAWLTLNESDKENFFDALCKVTASQNQVYPERMIGATAPQRCESFLRVKGLWK